MILDNVNSPEDLRRLETSDLCELCGDIRKYIVQCCSVNPGHVASSLGAVEIIVALHYVFNTPQDKIVFDVGHQAYAHKILTGRREAFLKNRVKDGISGFPRRDESPYDAFGAGHASSSISAALGLAQAAKIAGKNEQTIAVIGDGSISGGLALEGLNNAGDSDTDILVILNDNEMAIDGNKGALHSYLLDLTTNPAYNKLKNHVWQHLGSGKVRNSIQKFVRNAKSSLVTSSGGNLFEALGFRYFGPINGNDINLMINTLNRLKKIKGPKILHVFTLKGKGFAQAEADPTTWHSPGKFNPETGEIFKKTYPGSRYQDVFGDVLCELAEKDSKVVAITPAMASGSGLTKFSTLFPNRFFDVGIEEEHAATFAAGLAAGGLKPYCSLYSTFSQRAYDEIVNDVALQHLPVVFCFDRAGLIGEDGATHQGVFDMAAYRSIPNTVIAAPKDEIELKRMLVNGLEIKDGPLIIRYPRGVGECVDWKSAEATPIIIGKGEKLIDGEGVAILALGAPTGRAVEAAKKLKEEKGICPAVFNMRFLKPIDEEILESVSSFKHILTIEEGCLKGGLYSEVCEYFAGKETRPTIKGIGVPDKFISQATQAQQREECSLDTNSIEGIVVDLYENFSKSFGK